MQLLTTEEEGVALACGAWLGGQRAVLLMQSSGVGDVLDLRIGDRARDDVRVTGVGDVGDLAHAALLQDAEHGLRPGRRIGGGKSFLHVGWRIVPRIAPAGRERCAGMLLYKMRRGVFLVTLGAVLIGRGGNR